MIASVSNAQVKSLVQLKKKAKLRRQLRTYMTEGVRMFLEAPPEEILRIYVSESFARERGELLAGRDCVVLSDPVFSHVSDTKTPQGILCLLRMKDYGPGELLGSGDGVWLVLENLQDPGNLGAMFRTGEGAGISGIIMDKTTADIYNPKTVRSTMGSIYRVPFYIADDLFGMLEEMRRRGLCLCAAHPEGSVCYDEPDYRRGTAFLIGNEGNGLSDRAASAADLRVRIPMGGKLESLNAAMAAGILMYEANRQRRR